MWEFREAEYMGCCEPCSWFKGICQKLSNKQKRIMLKVDTKYFPCASACRNIVFVPLEKMKGRRF